MAGHNLRANGPDGGGSGSSGRGPASATSRLMLSRIRRTTSITLKDYGKRDCPSREGGERFSNLWPFSGMKQELLEGGLHVPSIVRLPERIAAGLVSEQVMATMDRMQRCWMLPAPCRRRPIHPMARTWDRS